jgi:UDP-N-acetylmuramoyl-tripeptide--D-alanyl-D-alanine ligase
MRVEPADPKGLTELIRTRYGLDSLPPITGITIDSRKVRAGDLFIPIIGSQVDGHDFILQACQAGAVAVMIEKENIPAPDRIVDIKVSNNITELGSLARAWREMHQPRIVAVTGSNGKTTTKDMVVRVLGGKYKVLGAESSYNSTVGLPLTLLGLDETCEVAVLELGSNHPGEIAYLASIAQPDVGLITNVSATHVAYLQDLNGVIREKEALFKALPADGTAVVNLDDPAVAGMKTRASRFTYALHQSADVQGRLETKELDRALVIGGKLRVKLSQEGAHLAQNGLAAVAVGLLFQVPADTIKEAIETFALPDGRGAVLQYNGVTVIDDSYNANLASTLAGLKILHGLPSDGRRIAVIGDMLELGPFSEEHHRQVGEFAAAQGVDEIYCYGPESRATYCTAQAAGLTAFHFNSKPELSHTLSQAVTAGDVVYVKGSRGMAMETVIEEVFGN